MSNIARGRQSRRPCSARSRRCSRRASRRNVITRRRRLCADDADQRRRRGSPTTAPSLAGERTAALAAATGRAACGSRDAYYGYGEYAAGGRALSRRAAEGRRGRQSASTSGSARRWRWPGSAPRRRRRSARSPGPRAELAQFWLLWLSTQRPEPSRRTAQPRSRPTNCRPVTATSVPLCDAPKKALPCAARALVSVRRCVSTT